MPWTSLEEKLKNLSELIPPTNCCIYKAPKRLREGNEKAYTPQIVSIGPLHHGEEHLKFMEEEKQRYLKEFLTRAEVSVKELFDLITKNEEKLRSCYAETINFNRDEFVEIILVDAAFIVELLLRYTFQKMRKKEDHIFGQPYLIQDLWYDMWLLENQIPFFILEEIFNLEKVSKSIPAGAATPQERKPRIIDLTYEYFKSLEAVNGKLKKFEGTEKNVEVKHFTDFLRICHLPSPEEKKRQETEKLKLKQEKEKLGKSKKEKRKEVVTAPSVIQLHQAGAKFKLSESKESFQINFRNGTLEIPQLKLQLETESLFRNLIAFEQRHYADNYINDYVFIIHHLANTPKDIELLVEKQIIENWLPDKEGASTLLNNLSRGTTLDPDRYYFSVLCEEMEKYRGKSYNKWRATLIQNYFSTPWASISVVGAVFLILLTVIQAVFSVIQVKIQQNGCS
ncbi:UPF0481 protein At3g47200-like [Pistacia vera]|uniref:UPF0481 protein At3g47200-like n=1 Tax=Pistacia vera TaxID=55513 RepID=UPI001263B8C3|nr:UPF0481 protein At3g47200-like [Pistacia vera]